MPIRSLPRIFVFLAGLLSYSHTSRRQKALSRQRQAAAFRRAVYDVLFEGQWLWGAAYRPPPTPLATGLSWTTVQEPADLIRWEAAWNGVPADDPSTLPPRTFLPALLSDPDIRFIAGYADRQIVAGAIANRTGDVVGVSNVFFPEADAAHYWARSLAPIIAPFPGLPLVGYERGNDLVIAQMQGFEVVGSLRVWGHSA